MCPDKVTEHSGHHRASQGIGDEKGHVNFAARKRRLQKMGGVIMGSYVMSIILYLLQTINPNNTFVTRFKSLLDKYPSVDIAAMGFPSGSWQDEPLWSTQS